MQKPNWQDVKRTEDGAEHGDSGKDPRQTLTAHEQSVVAWRELADDAKQTALQNSSKHWIDAQTHNPVRIFLFPFSQKGEFE